MTIHLPEGDFIPTPGGSGGGCGPAIVTLILAGVLIFYTVRGCGYVVETYIIKGANPNYVTSFEKAEKEEKERKTAEKKRAEKIEEIKNILPQNFRLYSCSEPEIFIINEKEVLATLRISQDESVLAETLDGGNTWRILLAGTENRYFGRPSASHKRGEKVITVFLDITGALKAQSKDDGKTWEYFDQYGRRINPIIKGGRIAVYPISP